MNFVELQVDLMMGAKGEEQVSFLRIIFNFCPHLNKGSKTKTSTWKTVLHVQQSTAQ